MSEQPRSVAVRDVEVRTWPQRTDLLIIDPYEALAIAHYPLVNPAPGKVADLTCGYEERARRAIEQLEADQQYLRSHYQVPDAEDVKLRAMPDVRQLMSEVLAQHDVTLDDLEMPALRATLKKLSEEPTSRLYELLCDWHDVVERHLPAGHTARDPQSWVHRARPDDGYHFHYLATGATSRDQATPEDSDDAYVLFRDLVDVELEHFSFGHALRWLYFHLTEFSAYKPFGMRALAQAGL